MPGEFIDVDKLNVLYNHGSVFHIDFSKCSFDGINLNGDIRLHLVKVDIDDCKELFDDCLGDIPVIERKVFNV